MVFHVQQNNLEWVMDCTLSMKFPTEQDATIFYTSYLPEHNIQPQKRSEVSLSQSLNEIIFIVKALDITAFRATINSILQFGNVVYKIMERVDSQK